MSLFLFLKGSDWGCVTNESFESRSECIWRFTNFRSSRHIQSWNNSSIRFPIHHVHQSTLWRQHSKLKFYKAHKGKALHHGQVGLPDEGHKTHLTQLYCLHFLMYSSIAKSTAFFQQNKLCRIYTVSAIFPAHHDCNTKTATHLGVAKWNSVQMFICLQLEEVRANHVVTQWPSLCSNERDYP